MRLSLFGTCYCRQMEGGGGDMLTNEAHCNSPTHPPPHGECGGPFLTEIRLTCFFPNSWQLTEHIHPLPLAGPLTRPGLFHALCLSVSLSVSVCLSLFISIYWSVWLYNCDCYCYCVSIHLCRFVSVSVYLALFLYIWLYLSLSSSLSVFLALSQSI